MKRIETPELVNDLYRDLRDRRLLIPAVALLVALIAVPVLMAKDSPPVSVPIAPPPAEATAAQPAVLAEQAGIRDYRDRLEALKSKNPFKQQFKLPTPESVAIAGGEPAPATAPVDTTSGSSAISTAPDTGSTATAPPSSDAGALVEPASTPSDSSGSSAGQPKTKLIARRVDVAIGPLGEAEKITNVRDLDFLPSNDEPLVAFLGVSESGKRASFLLSGDIVATDGDGSCVPDPCQFLTLKKGEHRFLHHQPEGASEPVVYRLKLLRIRDAVLNRN